MDVQSIPATFLRLHTRDLLERVKYRGERFLIETFGRPMVVLISYDDYLQLQACWRAQAGKSAHPNAAVSSDALTPSGSRAPAAEGLRPTDHL